jgi:hypothetical protein
MVCVYLITHISFGAWQHVSLPWVIHLDPSGQQAPPLEQGKIISDRLSKVRVGWGKRDNDNKESESDIPTCAISTRPLASSLASNQVVEIFLFLEWRVGNLGPTRSFGERMCIGDVDGQYKYNGGENGDK